MTDRQQLIVTIYFSFVSSHPHPIFILPCHLVTLSPCHLVTFVTSSPHLCLHLVLILASVMVLVDPYPFLSICDPLAHLEENQHDLTLRSHHGLFISFSIYLVMTPFLV